MLIVEMSPDYGNLESELYAAAGERVCALSHIGRGGWTWYTGSAGWMYRLILESLLGLRLEVDTQRFAPCLPADWQRFKLHHRYRETVYHITVTQPRDAGSAKGVTVDGVQQDDSAIPPGLMTAGSIRWK